MPLPCLAVGTWACCFLNLTSLYFIACVKEHIVVGLVLDFITWMRNIQHWILFGKKMQRQTSPTFFFLYLDTSGNADSSSQDNLLEDGIKKAIT